MLRVGSHALIINPTDFMLHNELVIIEAAGGRRGGACVWLVKVLSSGQKTKIKDGLLRIAGATTS